jgi:hypothetical protein
MNGSQTNSSGFVLWAISISSSGTGFSVEDSL